MGFKERKASDRSSNQGKISKATKSSNQDERFDTSKPQFRKQKSKDTKIELDSRFSTVLTDPKFQLQTLDKYGRKQSKDAKYLKQQASKEKMSEFYTIKSQEDGGPKLQAKNIDKRFALDEGAINQSLKESKDFKRPESDENENDNNEVDTVSRIAYLTALSRGEVEISSSEDEASEGDDESDEEESGNTTLDIKQENPGVLDPSYIEDITAVLDFTSNASPYLAVMNADWTHFRAVDIFAIISSFVPNGAVLRVSVYPSNFGKERLKKEELFGPVDVWKSDKRSNRNESSGDSEQEDSDDDNESNGDCIDNDEVGESRANNIIESVDDSDFDPEKLRLYEASRLKYYFAVVEFANTQYTDIAYKEVDGMEFEHSSAALDLRIIPVEEISNVVENRKLRDEATGVPSSYNPPDFVVNALQQSTVQCTWDAGDKNREILLTKYNVSGQTWGQVSDADDLKAYVASDQSSDEEGSVRISNNKSDRLRSMLGLESDDDDNGKVNSESDDSSQSDNEDEYVTQASYIPGTLNKTTTCTLTVNDEKQDRELTPWEKYQEKRQQKKREKRAAVRDKRKQVNEERRKGKSKVIVKETKKVDDFFVDQSDSDEPIAATSQFVKTDADIKYDTVENTDDNERDFDIRGVQRLEKNKDKKLKGARKRKEERLTGNIGTDFQIDTTDERFKAVLEGTDERFGIDRTDPNFKETPAMKQILSEQTQHRTKQRKMNNEMKQSIGNVPDVNAHTMKPTSGSAALSALVSSIKSKVMR